MPAYLPMDKQVTKNPDQIVQSAFEAFINDEYLCYT